MKKWLTIISMASIILLSSMSSFAGVVNGGFEDVSGGFTSIHGWQGDSDICGDMLGTFALIVEPNQGWGPAGEGSRYLLLNNGVNRESWVFQDVDMSAGEILSGYAFFSGPYLDGRDATTWASVSVNSNRVWFAENQGTPWTKWQWSAPQNGQYRLQLTLHDSWATGEIMSGFDGITISSVPIPGALWLFGTGLMGFIGLRKRLT